MAQEHVTKIENALTNSLNEIDKLYARKIQGDMHRCAASCCDKTSDSIGDVYICVKECSREFEKVQQFLQTEYTLFQNRLERSVLQCSDDILEKVGPNPTAPEIARYNREYEACVISCVNKHLDMIPNFMKRVKDVMRKKSYFSFELDDDPKTFREPTPL